MSSSVLYQITEVDPTSPLTKGKVYQVHKVTAEEAPQIGGKTYNAIMIKDPDDPLVSGKVYQVTFIADPTDPTVKGKVYNAIVEGGSEIVIIGPATAPLSLPDAIADSLTYVKAFGGTEQRNIPQPYTQVNYVTNTAQTAVDTGIMIDFAKNYEFEVECRAVSGSWYILQSRETTTSNITGISGSASGARITLVVGNVTACTSAITRVFGNKLYVKATLNNGVATLYVKDKTSGMEDTQVGSYDTTQPNPPTPVYLLGNAGRNYIQVNSNIYMARIKENDTVVMDYIPAKQGTTAGFYDKASGTFKVAITPENLSAGNEAVPTPDAPMDIVCNNGVLKPNTSATGYSTQTGTPTPTDPIDIVSYKQGDLILRGIGDYKDTYDATTGTITRNVGVKVLDGTETINTSTDVGSRHRYTTQLPNLAAGTQICYSDHFIGGKTISQLNTDATVDDAVTVYTSLVWFYTSTFATADALKQFLADQYAAGTPVIVYYPLVEPATEHYVGAYADGTVETIEDTIGNTATTEMLLKVGDYQDEQEIISGIVTRKVGVKVLDGTEDWSRSGVRTKIVLTDSATGSADWKPYCTHYQSFLGSASIGNMPDNSCKINVNTNELLIKDATHNTDLATWKQYLADQYAAGTPVIIVYPLATATTESVAGQTLNVTSGDNVIDITQASLTGLELEAEYTKAS